MVEVRFYRAEKPWLQSLAEVLTGKTTLNLLSATTPYATYLRWKQQLAAYTNQVALTLSELDLHAAFQKEIVATTSTARIRLIDALVGTEIRSERIALMKARLTRHRLSYFTHNGADDINWMLNIRGDDIAYNQLSLCYLLITPQSFSLYLPATPLDTIVAALAKDGVRIAPYRQYREDLRALSDGVSIGVIGRSVRCDVIELLRHKQMTITELDVPVDRYIKTESEITHLRHALIHEGVAMVRLLAHIQRSLDAGDRMTESAVYHLHLDYRGNEQSFLCESFPAIIAYQAHAAEIHYNCAYESDTVIAPRGVLLIDCGGHYLRGTTDITRVIACGAVSKQEREDYTAVLRSHIALATACFPHGSSGSSVDLCARIPLWRGMRDYRHGTGHGVGWGFNVHDGPYSLSPHASDKMVEPNMIFSNEPGVYRAGAHGIRIESLIRIVNAPATDQQTGVAEQASNGPTAHGASADAAETRFLACETLSLCPFDRALIDRSLLTAEEREWVDAYHRRVATVLTSHLSAGEQQWVAEQTASL